MKRCDEIFVELGLDVEYVEAVDGNEIYDEKYPIVAGYQGLNESIVNIIENAETNGFDKILILEDDVEFIDGALEIFDEHERYIPETWGALYLGGVNWFAPMKFKGRLHYSRRCLLGHAMGIRSTMFSKLKEELLKKDRPSDCCVADIYKSDSELNAYCFRPGICYQREGYSDNMNAKVPKTEVD